MKASLSCDRTLRRHRDANKIDLCSAEPKQLRTENKETELNLNDLPVELLKDILSRLPLAYLLQFARYTCPLWNFILSTPAFADLHLSRSLKNSDLLYSLKGDSGLYFMNNTPGHSSVGMKLIGDLGDRKKYSCFETCRGLLSYHSEEDKEAIYISNPILGDHVKIPLPNSEELARGFGYAPCKKKYKYIRFAYDKAADRNTCSVFTLGDNSWRELAHPHDFFDEWYSPVYCNGTLYWIAEHSSWRASEVYILSLDLDTERFRVRRVFPSFAKRGRHNSSVLLTVLSESVACVICSRETLQALVWGLEVWVLMDEAQDSWFAKYCIDSPLMPHGFNLKFFLSGLWTNNELYGIQQVSRTYRTRSRRAYSEITGMRCLSYNTDQRTYTSMQLPFANYVGVDGFSAQLIISHVGSLVSPSKIVAGQPVKLKAVLSFGYMVFV